jgi:two-component system nitrogen regulation response regulator NtrX
MRELQPEIVFLDIWMPGSLDGIEVLTTARKQFPQTEFVMISGHGTIETAVKEGLDNIFAKGTGITDGMER